MENRPQFLKRNILLLLLTLLLSPFAASAQFEYDSVLAKKDTPYVMNYNDPYTYPAFSLNLIPIYGEYQKINRVFGGGGQLDFLTKGASAMLNFVIAYPGYDNIKDRHIKTNTLNEPSLYKNFEGFVAYHFYDLNHETAMSYQPGGFDMRENLKEIYVPYKYRRIYAMRGGYQSIVSGVEGSEAQPLVSSQGRRFENVYFTTMTTNTIFAGIFTSRVDKMGLTDVTGRKRRRKVKTWFADVMIAPVIQIDSLNLTDNEFAPIGETPLNRFGWRVGYQIMNNQLTLTRIELGQRPGLQGFNYYGSITVGLTLVTAGGRRDLAERADRHRANIHRDTKTIGP